MSTFHIHHKTRYAYNRPVAFGDHRLMIRPRDSHDMRILNSSLTVTPSAHVRWAFDTFGNSVALLAFHEEDDELVIVSELELKRYGFDDPILHIERHVEPFPFHYDVEDNIDLAPLLPMLFPQNRSEIERWIRTVMPEAPSNCLQVLDLLGATIHERFIYRRRADYGVQSPAETIASASGTCRDFALLFMEAARILGFAARFVTGYLYDPGADETNGNTVSGGGATHAWADIFVPGAGWIAFDPTNRIIAGRNLIRVATTRTPAQAVPVCGTYHRNGAVFLSMEVEVCVKEID